VLRCGFLHGKTGWLYLNRVKRLVFGKNKILVQNIVTLFYGAFFSRLVALAAMPILTRLYTPEHFGVLSVFVSITAFVGSILSLRYSVALPLPRTEKAVSALLWVVLVISWGNCLLFLMLIYVFENRFIDALGLQSISGCIYLLALGAMGVSLYESLSYWATRDRAFEDLARSQARQSVFGVIVKIVSSFLLPGGVGLLCGQVVQQSAGIAYLFKRRQVAEKLRLNNLSARMIFYCLGKYRQFPLVRLPAALIYLFSIQAPILLTNEFFGAASTGYLGLALMVVALPVSLIAQTGSKAYYSEIAKMDRAGIGGFTSLTIELVSRLVIVSMAAFFCIYLLAEYVFVFVFGEDWRIAGQVASILAFLLLGQLVVNPLTSYFNIVGSSFILIFVNLTRALFTIAPFAFGIPNEHAFLEIMYFYSLSMLAYYAGLLAFILLLLHFKDQSMKLEKK
jgi:O-antigen/teichoic acid export membrane protein